MRVRAVPSSAKPERERERDNMRIWVLPIALGIFTLIPLTMLVVILTVMVKATLRSI